MSYGQDMERFMLMGGQTVGSLNIEQAGRYAGHIEEEARETKEAWLVGDAIKTLDGAVDLIVVALGLIHSLGVDPDKAWNAVWKANMRKVNGSCGPIVKREDGQLGKPDGWYGPEKELADLFKDKSPHPIHQHIKDMNP